MILLWILVLIGIPLVMRLRTRMSALERDVARQHEELQTLTERLQRRQRKGVEPSDAEAKPETVTPPVTEPVVAKSPVVTPPVVAPPPPPIPPLERPPVAPPVPAFQKEAEASSPPPPQRPPRPPRREPPQMEPEPAPSFPKIAIDWEAFVGVKLFSAVAGIALVLAAVFFLRYSIEQGWLGPQVRVAIGVIVATALLVVCELKAARKYAVTANALDAAASPSCSPRSSPPTRYGI